MTDTRPAYVVARPGPARDRVVAALGGRSPRPFDDTDAFVEADPEPGVTWLVRAAMPADQVLRALDHMAVGRGEWTPVLVQEEPAGEVARAVSLGYPHPLADAAATTEAEPTTLLELRAVLSEVSRSRHDINNPLTSALAETQLLLMDVDEAELRGTLETVLEQLRRIRDLIGATVHLRPLE